MLISGQDGQSVFNRLTDKHPVEWVFVQKRQACQMEGVFFGEGQFVDEMPFALSWKGGILPAAELCLWLCPTCRSPS